MFSIIYFQPAEIDTVQEELDLILSTSPGVVRLASFWIVRSRLAAAKDNVDRVICLLEQANAFDAQARMKNFILLLVRG